MGLKSPTPAVFCYTSLMSTTDPNLPYPDHFPPRLRYRYCPMCAAPMRMDFNGSVPHARCLSCGWVHHPASPVGVVVIVRCGGGIVFLFPPGLPAEAPAALPSTHCEYGESPEDAAAREVREKTGLEVEVVRSFGSFFSKAAEAPEPALTILLEARAVSGCLDGKEKGGAAVFPPELYPAIAPQRTDSRRAWQAYQAQA